MPRLSKGQIAIGVAMRQGNARVSTQARIDVLRGAQQGDAASHLIATTSFGTQQQLAELSLPQLGLAPLSLKTLRKNLGELFPGGYAGFAEEVANLLADARPEDLVNEQSRRFREAVIRAVKAETAIATGATLEMTERYLDLLERLKKLAKEFPAADKAVRQHLRLFEVTPQLRSVS